MLTTGRIWLRGPDLKLCTLQTETTEYETLMIFWRHSEPEGRGWFSWTFPVLPSWSDLPQSNPVLTISAALHPGSKPELQENAFITQEVKHIDWSPGYLYTSSCISNPFTSGTIFGQESSCFKLPCQNFAWWHDNKPEPSMPEAPEGKSCCPDERSSGFGSEDDFSVTALVHFYVFC